MKLLWATKTRPTLRSLSACRWWISLMFRCWCGRRRPGHCLAMWLLPRTPMWIMSSWNATITAHQEKLILAKSLVEKVFGRRRSKVLETFKGKKLKGVKYHPLFTFLPPDKPAHFVVLGDFVTTEDGTGLVHMAPAFGQEDMEMAKEHNLPVLMTVLPDGTFIPEVTPWRGQFVKDADPLIIEDLHARGLLFKSEAYTHTYPFCWRCHTPLLYYARESWYIRTSAYRDRLVELNNTINWVPEHIKRRSLWELAGK